MFLFDSATATVKKCKCKKEKKKKCVRKNLAVSRTFLWSVGGGDNVVSVGNFQNTLSLSHRTTLEKGKF
jgi:hypothetical protein